MLEIENSTKEPGIIIQEVQKGYMMKNRLLRPSLVGVAKKTLEKDDKKWIFWLVDIKRAPI